MVLGGTALGVDKKLPRLCTHPDVAFIRFHVIAVCVGGWAGFQLASNMLLSENVGAMVVM